MKISESNVNRINSLLCALFFAETNICAVISNILPVDNIVVIAMIGLLVAHVIINKKIIYSHNSIIAMSVIVLAFVVSGIINGFPAVINYFLHFGMFGITAMLLTSVSINPRYVVNDLLMIYGVHFVCYFLFDRAAFLSSDNYWELQMGMAYGFTPAVVLSFAVLVNRKIFSAKSITFALAVAELLVGIFIIFGDCGTRGAWITIVLSCLFLSLDKIDLKKYWKLSLLVVSIGVLLTLNIQSVAAWIQTLPIINEFPALSKMIRQLQYGDFTSGRVDLYSDAMQMIADNWLFGNGIGAFETRNGNYVHQFFIDILCTFGAAGFIALTYVFAVEVVSLMKEKSAERKIMRQFIFSTPLFMLLLSNSFWMLPQFWFLFFYLMHRRTNLVKMMKDLYRRYYG